jgi:hypothetical protein
MKIDMRAGRGRDLAVHCSRLDLRAETDEERVILARLAHLAMKDRLVRTLALLLPDEKDPAGLVPHGREKTDNT